MALTPFYDPFMVDCFSVGVATCAALGFRGRGLGSKSLEVLCRAKKPDKRSDGALPKSGLIVWAGAFHHCQQSWQNFKTLKLKICQQKTSFV